MTVYLVHGEDPVLLGDEVRKLIEQLVGDGDRSLLVHELNEVDYEQGDDYSITPLIDGAQTLPFLTDRRIVVGRQIARFSKAADLKPLLAYVENPLETSDLVLVWEKGPRTTNAQKSPPKPLKDAIAAAKGEIRDTGIPRGKGASQWLDQQIDDGPVPLDRAARKMLADRLGEDRSRVASILTTLASAFGTDRDLTPDDVGPYLGEAGTVAPWDLTDALNAGNVAGALDVLRRMMGAGEKHGLQVLYSLQRHYTQMLTLDGADVGGEKQAAALLGIKGSTFPAKKAMQQSRKLGSDKIAQGMRLIAQADLDLKGTTALDHEPVMEVLVARLARLSR